MLKKYYHTTESEFLEYIGDDFLLQEIQELANNFF